MSAGERFTCRLDRDDDSRLRSVVIEVDDPYDPPRVVGINGLIAGLVAGPARQILKGGGVRAKEWASSTPIELDAQTGAHLWLLASAVRPLRRADRVGEVAEQIAEMSREEAAYWYAKGHSARGLRALRLLLSPEGRRT